MNTISYHLNFNIFREVYFSTFRNFEFNIYILGRRDKREGEIYW